MMNTVKGVTIVLIAIDAMGGDNAPECNVEGRCPRPRNGKIRRLCSLVTKPD